MKVRSIRNRIKARTAKRYFELFFRHVEVSSNLEIDGFLLVDCRDMYLTRLCSVHGMVKKEDAVFWISDLLNAYLEEKHHVGLGARPACRGDGTFLFIISEKGAIK